MIEPRLDDDALEWQSPRGRRFRLGFSSPVDPQATGLESLQYLPQADGQFLDWAVCLGPSRSLAVHKALLAFWQACAEAFGREAVVKAGGGLLRLRILAGLARASGRRRHLDQYLEELQALVAGDSTFAAERSVESGLLAVLEPVDPVALFDWDLAVLTEIERWLASRMAWGHLLRFRGWRARAAKALGSWRSRVLDVRDDARAEGDTWTEQTLDRELDQVDNRLRAAEAAAARRMVRRWRHSVTRPSFAACLLMGPLLLFAVGPFVPAHDLPGGAGFFLVAWIAAGAWFCHQLLYTHPRQLWGGMAGGLVVGALGSALKQPALGPGTVQLTFGVALVVAGLVLTGRLAPLRWEDRLARAGLLVAATLAFHFAVALGLLTFIASVKSELGTALLASSFAVGPLEFAVPWGYSAATAVSSTAAAIWYRASGPGLPASPARAG